MGNAPQLPNPIDRSLSADPGPDPFVGTVLTTTIVPARRATTCHRRHHLRADPGRRPEQ